MVSSPLQDGIEKYKFWVIDILLWFLVAATETAALYIFPARIHVQILYVPNSVIAENSRRNTAYIPNTPISRMPSRLLKTQTLTETMAR